MEKQTAIIFDLDGTLWDSAKEVAESWELEGRKVISPSFRFTEADSRAQMGKTMDEIVDSILPGESRERKAEVGQALFKAEDEYLLTHPGKLYPKEEETLQRLLDLGYRLYIVSNCQFGYIETFLPLVKPGTFLDHMCFDDTKKSKDVTIRALMDRDGLEKAVYIGDTHKDEESARKAGIPFIHAAYGFGKAVSPDEVAVDFPSIVDCLEHLRLP